MYPIKTKSDLETVLGQNYDLSEDVMIKTKVIAINGINKAKTCIKHNSHSPGLSFGSILSCANVCAQDESTCS